MYVLREFVANKDVANLISSEPGGPLLSSVVVSIFTTLAAKGLLQLMIKNLSFLCIKVCFLVSC